MSAADRDAAKKAIDNMLYTIVAVEAVLHSAPAPDSQQLLNQRLNDLLGGINALKDISGAFKEVEVPVDMVRALDEGVNPDQYTAGLFKAALRDNQISKGRVVAFKELQQQLLVQLDAVYPEQAKEYRQVLDAARASAAAQPKPA